MQLYVRQFKTFAGCYRASHLHPLNRVRGGVGLVNEVSVLHVLCEALQEAERLVENHWHCNLGELLKRHEGELRDQVSLRRENKAPSHGSPLKVQYSG